MNTYVGRQMPENGIENGIYFDEENNKIKIFSNNEETFSNNVIQDNSIFGTWRGKLFDEPIYYKGEFHDIEYSEITFFKSIIPIKTYNGYVVNYVKNMLTNSEDILNIEFFYIVFTDSNALDFNSNLYELHNIGFQTFFIENNELKIIRNGDNYKLLSFEKIENTNSFNILENYSKVEGKYYCLDNSIKNDLLNVGWIENFQNEHQEISFNELKCYLYIHNDIYINRQVTGAISLYNENEEIYTTGIWYYIKQDENSPYHIKITVSSSNQIIIKKDLENINFVVDGSIGDKISFTINGNEYILVKES